MSNEAIFIGYRRDDTADVAGRIYDALAQRFGKSRVFKDVDNIGPGADFGNYIRTVLPRCRVALVLIGPQWLDAKNEGGQRRLDDNSDLVRTEIETALGTPSVLVVPVLVNGARMPLAEELPDSLKPLLRRNAAIIRRDPDFHDDVERLSSALRVSVNTGVLDLSKIGGRGAVATPRKQVCTAVERTKTPFATTLGVLIALGVPTALVPTGILRAVLTHFAPPDSIAYAGLREAFFWGLTALVLLVLTLGEKQPLSAIGFKRPTSATFLWGFIGLALIFVTEPLGGLLMRAVGGTLPLGTIIRIASLPLWLVGLTVLRAGVCEELLFRGYGMDRFAALTGSRAFAAILTAFLFMLGHAEAYGAAYMLNILPVTIILTGLYLWRRDLWTNIIAHFMTDAIGLTIFILSSKHH